MSEENQEVIIEESRSASSRKSIYIATGVIGVLVIGALIFWLWRGRETGQIVPAPRNVTFGDTSASQPTDTAGEQTLTIPPDEVDRIGLKIETVGETLSSEATSVAATGVIQPNAYNETPVISLLGGVLRRVNGELGQNVSRGQTVAVIFSDELAASESRYLALQTEAQTSSQNYDRTAKLVKISPVSNAELDKALARLKTTEAELAEHHQHHYRTAKLLEIGAVSREEYEMATTKLKTAEADAEESKKQYDRAVKVAQINPISRSEFEQAAVKRQTAESELATAKQRLLLLGLSPRKVNSLRSPSQITSEVALAAPVSGTITKRDVNQGEVVEANKELMRITNLAAVWVIAQVYEKDLGSIREGSGASVTTDAYPGRLFRGHVTYIDPLINPLTRTAQVRVELDNPGQILKIGMYVNAAFGSMGAAERTVPMIPASGVQEINDHKVVFAVTEKPNVFLVKPVRLGAENNVRSVVLEGVNVGDRIVTDGSFLLRAEVLKQYPLHQ